MFKEFVDLINFAITEPFKIVGEVTDEFVDNIERKVGILNLVSADIEPTYGSPIFSPFGRNFSGHSGIYIGDKRVIALNGKGTIAEVSLFEFTNNPAIVHKEIYVPCYSDLKCPIGFPIAGVRAFEKIGSKRNYHVIMDNCHQFCSGCLTGDFENADNALWMLKDRVTKEHGESVCWRKWKWR
jgi:hypothetical protein